MPKPPYPSADQYLHRISGRATTAAHTEGLILKENGDIALRLSSVLFDSGALHSSYISSDFVSANIDLLNPFLRSSAGQVKLGDNRTVVNIDKVLEVPLLFVDDNGHDHTAHVKLAVFPMDHLDAIIGLPDIISHFFVFFTEMLREAKENNSHEDLKLLISLPWTSSTENPDAPEEEELPQPCSFSHALHFLNKPFNEAIEEYHQLFEKQVCPEMIANCPAIMELLRTKGVKVFIPHNWDGINGFEPIELTLKDGAPTELRPRVRPINPKLYENALNEFKRLRSYFYEESLSPIASPLVIAPKNTNPFIRFCGDYTEINKWIVRFELAMPLPMYELPKASRFRIFIDVDMANSFHQFLLSLRTSQLLTVATPWGSYRPKFLPEGVSPASAVLQKAVMSMFSDFEEWTIVIFDNILICAHDYDDAYRKLELFLDRCIERNVILKFTKTFIGFPYAKFFGYIVKHGQWSLAPERIDSISAIPMPKCTKQMQSLLGMTLIFRHFIPQYSALCAPLHDMCKKDFAWSAEAIGENEIHLKTLKAALEKALTLYFPDYNLQWVLHTDASAYAVGSVLYQVRVNPDESKSLEPLFCYSAKLSDAATRWDIHKKECYGIVRGVKDNEYVLRGKHFTLYTDHANLLHMEQHTAPIVIRWRLYLQSFSFSLFHIKGELNLADYFSRLHLVESTLPEESTNQGQTLETVFDSVHNGKVGHWGIKRTYALLNKFYPGHNIPIRVLSERISNCAVCQKDRLTLATRLKSIKRHLHQPDLRACIAMDLLTVTPVDEQGNRYLLVIINLFSKLVALYPTKDKEASTTAGYLILYFSTYGVTNRLHSDPGSDYTSKVLGELVQWYGVTQTFTLVDRPQASGVENTNHQILRHLRAIVMDYRCANSWSSPAIIGIIQYLLNSSINEEIDAIPFELHFGSETYATMRLPLNAAHASEYLKHLNEDLLLLRGKSHDYQESLIRLKTVNNPVDNQPLYQPGDYVLFDKSMDNHRDFKLQPKYLGPYVVLKHTKNDVQCRHIIQDSVLILPADQLRIFVGDEDAAYKAALSDFNQYVVVSILGYSGDPQKRSKMDFIVQYASGHELFLPFCKDIDELIVFESFIRNLPELFLLLHPASEVPKLVSSINKAPITGYDLNQAVYVNLRVFGSAWYNTLLLPDKFKIRYIFHGVIDSFNPSRTKAFIKFHQMKRKYEFYPLEFRSYISSTLSPKDNLIDDKTMKKYIKTKP